MADRLFYEAIYGLLDLNAIKFVTNYKWLPFSETIYLLSGSKIDNENNSCKCILKFSKRRIKMQLNGFNAFSLKIHTNNSFSRTPALRILHVSQTVCFLLVIWNKISYAIFGKTYCQYVVSLFLYYYGILLFFFSKALTKQQEKFVPFHSPSISMLNFEYRTHNTCIDTTCIRHIAEVNQYQASASECESTVTRKNTKS